jgi:hypothetical protein
VGALRRTLAVLASVAGLLAAAFLVVGPGSTEADGLHARKPVPGRVVPGLTHVRDGFAPKLRLRSRRATASAYGGNVRASNGEYVKVLLSDAYTPDPAVLQAWADFMAGLHHGSELSHITVYVAPPTEVGQICGAGFDACYDSGDPASLAVPGSDTDEAYIELVAAHEYGHHIDANRRNDPWDAGNWGPKYWATYENVCHRVRHHTAYPGDEGDHYRQNPDENWAESFAVLNGYPWEDAYYDAGFKPDAGSLREMRFDIHEPWTGRTVRTRRGRRSGVVRLNANDGRLGLSLRARGADDLVLYTIVHHRKRVLKRARHRGHRTHLRFTVCGQYPLRVKVVRRSGSARFKMRIVEP